MPPTGPPSVIDCLGTEVTSQQVRSSAPRSKVLRHGRTFWLRFLALLFGHVQRDPDMLPPLSRFAGLSVQTATLGTRWLDLKFLAYPAPG
jgi:hypothetical protein